MHSCCAHLLSGLRKLLVMPIIPSRLQHGVHTDSGGGTHRRLHIVIEHRSSHKPRTVDTQCMEHGYAMNLLSVLLLEWDAVYRNDSSRTLHLDTAPWSSVVFGILYKERGRHMSETTSQCCFHRSSGGRNGQLQKPRWKAAGARLSGSV